MKKLLGSICRVFSFIRGASAVLAKLTDLKKPADEESTFFSTSGKNIIFTLVSSGDVKEMVGVVIPLSRLMLNLLANEFEKRSSEGK